MGYDEKYLKQTKLLFQILPFAAEEECFALKGGSAINFFLRDMPRLSVDLDLTYLPVRPRAETLAGIDAALKRIAAAARRSPRIREIALSLLGSEGTGIKLVVRTFDSDIWIKVEVTPVMRGRVFDPETRPVSDAARRQFGRARMQILSKADVYAGKILAALSRQHPRDLFDMRLLLADEGIGDDLRTAFVVYLISDRRPMHELLAPNPRDVSLDLEKTFVGMTERPPGPEELHAALEATVEAVVGGMPDAHRRFLVSFERGEPEWSLLGVDHAPGLPSVRWRQINLDKLDRKRRSDLVRNLEQVLDR